tara:strand:+ start:3536 stop:3886 length:351 start_codon:yes stop_codon:yes gene_type:complete
MLVHHSTTLAGSLGVIGLHASSGRGVRVFQISAAITLPTVDSGLLLDAATGFALAVDGGTAFMQSSWGFSMPRTNAADSLKSFSYDFPNGIIVQDLEISAFVPSAADWYVFYRKVY